MHNYKVVRVNLILSSMEYLDSKPTSFGLWLCCTCGSCEHEGTNKSEWFILVELICKSWVHKFPKDQMWHDIITRKTSCYQYQSVALSTIYTTRNGGPFPHQNKTKLAYFLDHHTYCPCFSYSGVAVLPSFGSICTITIQYVIIRCRRLVFEVT